MWGEDVKVTAAGRVPLTSTALLEQSPVKFHHVSPDAPAGEILLNQLSASMPERLPKVWIGCAPEAH